MTCWCPKYTHSRGMQMKGVININWVKTETICNYTRVWAELKLKKNNINQKQNKQTQA